MVSFYQTGNPNNDRWEFADSTGQASEGQATGPFETYLDALSYVNKFIPELGIEELPDRDVPPDAVVEIGSYPNKATERECAECDETVFSPYRVEYGDGSHEWLCPPCAADRFNWDTEKEPTATLDFAGDDMYDGLDVARESLEAHAEALLGSEVVDVNTMAMVMKTLYQHRYNSRRDNPDDLPAAYGLYRRLMHVTQEYREENPDASWADIREAFDEMRKFAHEYAREESGKSQGRRELITEVQESDLSPNEWFEQHIEGDG